MKTNIREGYRKLSDPEKNSNKICKVLTVMKNLKLITENTFEFLNVKNPKAGRFYLLPKIHKKQVPGRPLDTLHAI